MQAPSTTVVTTAFCTTQSSYTDMLPEFGGDTLYQDNDNFMTGRSNGLATYRNSNFFGLVDGLNFAVQYQGKNEEVAVHVMKTATAGVPLCPMTLVWASAQWVHTALLTVPTLSQQAGWGNGDKADAWRVSV